MEGLYLKLMSALSIVIVVLLEQVVMLLLAVLVIALVAVIVVNPLGTLLNEYTPEIPELFDCPLTLTTASLM